MFNVKEWALIQSRLVGMTSAGIAKYHDISQPNFSWISPVFCGSDDIGFYQENLYTKRMTIDAGSPTGFEFQVLADMTRLYLLKERDAEGFCLSRLSTSNKKDRIIFAQLVEDFQSFNRLWDFDYSGLFSEFKNSGVPEIRTLSEPIRYIRDVL